MNSVLLKVLAKHADPTSCAERQQKPDCEPQAIDSQSTRNVHMSSEGGKAM